MFARALDPSLGALDVEPELASDAAGLKRSERCGGASATDPSGTNVTCDSGPVGIEARLDLLPLFDGPHRRISIMAAR